MRRQVVLALVASVVLNFASSAVEADMIRIDFESFPGPDGILGSTDDIPAPDCGPGPFSFCGPLSSEFSSVGLTFSSGTLFQGNFFPGSSPSNHYISSSPPNVTLSVPVFGISIESYSFWTGVLTAFDMLDNVIATDVLENPDEGMSFLAGTLSVSTSQPIRRFTVQAQGGPDLILNLDNLTLNPVPEPSACHDEDGDGEANETDACPNTPHGVKIDQAGCSLQQFCSAIDASTLLGALTCKKSDWKNDQPLMKPSEADCTVAKGARGRFDDRCVPREQGVHSQEPFTVN